jgi:hypothetical protein
LYSVFRDVRYLNNRQGILVTLLIYNFFSISSIQ